MSSIRVKIIDTDQPTPWFASAFCPLGKKPEEVVADLNRRAKTRFSGTVTYELATEEQYQAYRKDQK